MTTQPINSMKNVFSGDAFNSGRWLEVPPRTFEAIHVGNVFRAPSRTLMDAHTSEFKDIVMRAITIFNRKGERVLSGTQKFMPKRFA